jgi:hypothetical protein
MRLRTWLVLPLLLLLVAPAAARASGADVIKDCTDGGLTKTYPQRDYRAALANMPTDVDEYTDCRDAIRRAYLAGAAGGGKSSSGGSGGGGGSTGGGGGTGTGGGAGTAAGGDGAAASTGSGTGSAAPAAAADPAALDPLAAATPEERAAFQKAVVAGAAPVKFDGRPVTPGALGGSSINGLGDLPTPVLVVLALLAAGALASIGHGARRLVVSRNQA